MSPRGDAAISGAMYGNVPTICPQPHAHTDIERRRTCGSLRDVIKHNPASPGTAHRAYVVGEGVWLPVDVRCAKVDDDDVSDPGGQPFLRPQQDVVRLQVTVDDAPLLAPLPARVEERDSTHNLSKHGRRLGFGQGTQLRQRVATFLRSK